MAHSDNRVSIRNVDTGELAHGISGHIPDGWEIIHATEEPKSTQVSKTLADKSMGQTQRKSERGNVVEHKLQTVRPEQNPHRRKATGGKK